MLKFQINKQQDTKKQPLLVGHLDFQHALRHLATSLPHYVHDAGVEVVVKMVRVCWMNEVGYERR